jgi:hypothetical protein
MYQALQLPDVLTVDEAARYLRFPRTSSSVWPLKERLPAGRSTGTGAFSKPAWTTGCAV